MLAVSVPDASKCGINVEGRPSLAEFPWVDGEREAGLEMVPIIPVVSARRLPGLPTGLPVAEDALPDVPRLLLGGSRAAEPFRPLALLSLLEPPAAEPPLLFPPLFP